MRAEISAIISPSYVHVQVRFLNLSNRTDGQY